MEFFRGQRNELPQCISKLVSSDVEAKDNFHLKSSYPRIVDGLKGSQEVFGFLDSDGISGEDAQQLDEQIGQEGGGRGQNVEDGRDETHSRAGVQVAVALPNDRHKHAPDLRLKIYFSFGSTKKPIYLQRFIAVSEERDEASDVRRILNDETRFQIELARHQLKERKLMLL